MPGHSSGCISPQPLISSDKGTGIKVYPISITNISSQTGVLLMGGNIDVRCTKIKTNGTNRHTNNYHRVQTNKPAFKKTFNAHFYSTCHHKHAQLQSQITQRKNQLQGNHD